MITCPRVLMLSEDEGVRFKIFQAIINQVYDGRHIQWKG